MPTATIERTPPGPGAPPPATGPKDFWEDLEAGMPPGSLSTADRERITRDELLARIAALGAGVDLMNLRRWEYERYLPNPRVRGRPPRALYPAWTVDAIATAADLHDQGLDWETIGTRIRNVPALARMGQWIRLAGTTLSGDEQETLFAYARRHARRIGRPVAKVEVVLRDPAGEVVGRNGIGIADPAALLGDDPAA